MRIRHYLLALLVIGLIAYIPSWNNQFVWDDEQFIYKNVHVLNFDLAAIFSSSTTSGAGIESNYFRPLTSLSFAINHALFGLEPLGFHLTNTALHLGAGVFLFLLMLELLGSKRFLGPPRRVAFLLSLFFLINPLQTEAVTYINSRGDSFYALLAMMGLLSFTLSFRQKPLLVSWRETQFKLHSGFLLIISLLLYGATILAKEIGLATLGLYWLIALLKLFETGGTFKERFEKLRPQFEALGALVFIAICYLFLRGTVWNFANSFNFYDDDNLYANSLLVRLLTFSKIFFVYLKLLFVPYPLHMERSLELVTSLVNPYTPAFLMVQLLILWSAFLEWRQRQSVWLLFGWGWFISMLLPVSGIIPINGLLYEHWLYLPQVGFWLSLAVLISLYLPSRLLSKLKTIAAILLCAVMVAWLLLTWRQHYLWQDPIRFYTHTLNHAQSARLYNNLGMALSEAGRFEEAVAAYEDALNINPFYPQIHHNLGNLFQELGQDETAITHYEKALEIQPDFFYSVGPLYQLYLETNNASRAASLRESY